MGNKRKVYAYNDSTVSYADDIDGLDEVSRYNESKLATKRPTPAGDTLARTNYVELVSKSLQEFNRLQRLVDHLKKREVLGLQTCDKAGTLVKKQTATEKTVKIREGFNKSQDIISKGLQRARMLVSERRALCADSLRLRQRWRVVQDAAPVKQIITHDQAIAVDCSDLSFGGDPTGIPDGIFHVVNPSDMETPASPECTLQVSLVHAQSGPVCSESLWGLLYPPQGEADQSDGGFSKLDNRCRAIAHNKICRFIYRTLCHTASSTPTCSVGCSAALGEKPAIVNWEGLRKAFMEESLCSHDFLTCISRSEVHLSLSESIVLTVRLVPLGDIGGPSIISATTMNDEAVILRPCRLVVSLACLSLFHMLPQMGNTRRTHTGGVGVGGGGKVPPTTRRNIREGTGDMVDRDSVVAVFLRQVKHRLLVCRTILCLRDITCSMPSLQYRVVGQVESQKTVIVLIQGSVMCIMRIDPSTAQLEVLRHGTEGGVVSKCDSYLAPHDRISATPRCRNFIMKELPPDDASIISFCDHSVTGEKCVGLRLQNVQQLREYIGATFSH